MNVKKVHIPGFRNKIVEKSVATQAEMDKINKQRDEDEKHEKSNAIWDFFLMLTLVKREGKELDDLRNTIDALMLDYVKQNKLDDKQYNVDTGRQILLDICLNDYSKRCLFITSADGILVHISTLQCKLEEYYMAHQKGRFALEQKRRKLIEGYKMTHDQIQAEYDRIVAGKVIE
jgi:hypothetical protein